MSSLYPYVGNSFFRPVYVSRFPLSYDYECLTRSPINLRTLHKPLTGSCHFTKYIHTICIYALMALRMTQSIASSQGGVALSALDSIRQGTASLNSMTSSPKNAYVANLQVSLPAVHTLTSFRYFIKTSCTEFFFVY